MTNSLKSLTLASALLVAGAGAALALPPWATGGSLGTDPTAQSQQQQEQRNRAIASWQPQRQGWTSLESLAQAGKPQVTGQNSGYQVR
ncbi:MAG: hypothetical protein JO227_06015 [Acetobacteraceae bacterium]|nr:hypothetical protein [Acetobacteraceae bacterium]